VTTKVGKEKSYLNPGIYSFIFVKVVTSNVKVCLAPGKLGPQQIPGRVAQAALE